jgi:hypothetical protein
MGQAIVRTRAEQIITKVKICQMRMNANRNGLFAVI